MNEHLFDGINMFAGRWSALDAVARFGASDAIFVLAALTAVFGLAELARNPRRGVGIGIVGLTALAVCALLIAIAGHLVTEARPFAGDADTRLLVRHAADSGFPSDHSVVAAAAAAVGVCAWGRRALPLVALAVVIGLARVFVGVHLPGDVVAGWALGAIAGVSGWALVTLPGQRWRRLAFAGPR